MIGKEIGNYRITEKLGEGGMGAVFKGVDMMLEREVAIKALRPDLMDQPDLVERFRAEAMTLAKLNHPNIALLYSFFREGDQFFMVLEYVRGTTLDKVIHQRGAIAWEQALPLFCHALEGLEQAHAYGIVHRDIKPANMMLTEAGTLKVMDFGIARTLGTDRLTRTGHAIGTLQYMSPEQIRGQETDARSDIYSLGILLYEMVTGRVPFSSQSEYDLMRSQIEEIPATPRTVGANVPAEIESAIMRALAKTPEQRFQTVAEFRRVLLPLLQAAAPTLRGIGLVNPVTAEPPAATLVDFPTTNTGGGAAPNAYFHTKATGNAPGSMPSNLPGNTQGGVAKTQLFVPNANQAPTQSSPETSVPPTVMFQPNQPGRRTEEQLPARTEVFQAPVAPPAPTVRFQGPPVVAQPEVQRSGRGLLYAGLAAILVALISAPLAWYALGRKQPTEPAVDTTPVQTTTQSPAPAPSQPPPAVEAPAATTEPEQPAAPARGPEPQRAAATDTEDEDEAAADAAADDDDPPARRAAKPAKRRADDAAERARRRAAAERALDQ